MPSPYGALGTLNVLPNLIPISWKLNMELFILYSILTDQLYISSLLLFTFHAESNRIPLPWYLINSVGPVCLFVCFFICMFVCFFLSSPDREVLSGSWFVFLLLSCLLSYIIVTVQYHLMLEIYDINLKTFETYILYIHRYHHCCKV